MKLFWPHLTVQIGNSIDFASNVNLFSIRTVWHLKLGQFFSCSSYCMNDSEVIKKSVFHNTITVQMPNVIFSAPN